ncbi:MAG: hypothetical protein JWR61_5298 [Ferruginibacter sp.]|uniref:FkbM family methyltransferase n=1 Tax=Ferruginibacter sp. TaxID=1940288 RepID=UPI00265833CA|nr:FkbM family methyltransferase [Ferruginibacter sp.]MDB5280343.1 hypothetical protein [Ferruginibacter sp.]
MKSFKNLIKSSFNLLGLELANQKAFKKLETEKAALKLAFNRLTYVITHSYGTKEQQSSLNLLNYCGDKLLESKSQLLQELFVLYILRDKRNGFFIEFGAADGIDFSNTYLLEKDYGWKGILAEPGKSWKQQLRKNRNCIIDNRCVWTKTGESLTFYETDIAELSTIDGYANDDLFAEQRKNKKAYIVDTISLTDLLKFHNAPVEIHFLSIDTEGSEYDILKSFDFSEYNIQIITVEHNFSSNRDNIFNLLRSNHYRRVFETISFFDDWYVKEDVWNEFIGK